VNGVSEPPWGYLTGMKGDRVEIVVDAGDITKTYDVQATRAGRRVEIVNRRGLVEVSELTRSGTPVRTARFMASRVIALVEHPAGPRGGRAAAGSQGSRPETGAGAAKS
jgi:hypothetical protein